MRQFEYKVIDAVGISQDGFVIAEKRSIPLAYLGKDGWELCGVIPGVTCTVVFKRELQPSSFLMRSGFYEET